MSEKKSNRKLAAIMFADIVSYSRMMGSNEEEALKLLQDFEDISSKIVNDHEGLIIKKNGDEIFCEFGSSKNAVDASLKLQNKLSEYNDSRPKDFKLEVRIGIHIGDVVKREDGDIHGDGVNVAARIQPLSAPGGICVSGAVSDALSSHPDYDVISKGEQELKNILQKHSIFQVKTGHEVVEPTGEKQIKPTTTTNRYSLYSAIIVFLAAISVLLYNNYINQDDEILSLMITPLTSQEDLKDIVVLIYEKNEFEEIPDDIKLSTLSQSELDDIYAEFLSYSEVNKYSNEMNIKSNHMLDEEYKRKGIPTPKFDFESLRVLYGSLFGLNDKDFGESLNSLECDSLSVLQYSRNVSKANFSYFPVIFKFDSPNYLHYGDYIMWNTITFRHGNSYNVIGEAHITSYENIAQSMHSTLNYKINSLLASSHAYIKNINGDEVLIKFDPNNKGQIKERMIYNVDRAYSFNQEITQDEFDSLVTKRINALLAYELNVNKNKKSVYYKRFYDNSDSWYSEKELNELLDGNHMLHDMYNGLKLKDGNSTMSISEVSRIKIDQVFDSTATAIIYKPKNPNRQISVGDYILY